MTGSVILAGDTENDNDNVMDTDIETGTPGSEPVQSVQMMFRTFTISPSLTPRDSGDFCSILSLPPFAGYGFVVTCRSDWAPTPNQIRDLTRWQPSQSQLSEDQYRHWRPTSDYVQLRGTKMWISDLMQPIMSVPSLRCVDWDLTPPVEIQPDKVDSIFQEVSGERSGASRSSW
jgi:hypothetical protein